jgi:hypothetical protein
MNRKDEERFSRNKETVYPVVRKTVGDYDDRQTYGWIALEPMTRQQYQWRLQDSRDPDYYDPEYSETLEVFESESERDEFLANKKNRKQLNERFFYLVRHTKDLEWEINSLIDWGYDFDSKEPILPSMQTRGEYLEELMIEQELAVREMNQLESILKRIPNPRKRNNPMATGTLMALGLGIIFGSKK